MLTSPRFRRWSALLFFGGGFASLIATACGSSNGDGTPDGGGGDTDATVDGAGATDGGTSIEVGDATLDPGAFGEGQAPIGTVCATPSQCATGQCTGGQCAACTSDNQACVTDAECCGGSCTDTGSGKTCKPIPNGGLCKSLGNTCGAASECCSSICRSGYCDVSSFCKQTNDSCRGNAECCTGFCSIAAGSAVGVCTVSAGSGVGGCAPAGTVCTGTPGGTCDKNCCSKACGPFAPTGTSVCQVPSGCRPTGETCQADSDCCGTADGGTATCSKAAGSPVGACTQGTGAQRAGEICKPPADSTGTCGTQNNCREPVGATGSSFCNSDPSNCCKVDILGIPRCVGYARDCTGPAPTGQACATSADCCGLPCVPGPSGSVCGATACQAGGATCSSDADCCAGNLCIFSTPGASAGTCGAYQADGGVGSGTTGGATGGTTGGTCSAYGQTCTTDTDCCSYPSTVCSGGRCLSPIN